MPFDITVFTPMLDYEHFLEEVNDVFGLLAKHKIEEVEMSFGYSWGDWELLNTPANEVMDRIKSMEMSSGATFGENDVYIMMHGINTEILFCHEADLHLSFDRMGPLVSDILNSWKERKLIHAIQRNGEAIELGELNF